MVQLLKALRRMPVQVPVTRSHASSLSLLTAPRLARFAERMAAADLRVIALPFTNAWLLARADDATPIQRPQARSVSCNAAAFRWRLRVTTWLTCGSREATSILGFAGRVDAVDPVVALAASGPGPHHGTLSDS